MTSRSRGARMESSDEEPGEGGQMRYVLALALSLAVAVPVGAETEEHPKPFDFVVLGDMPYVGEIPDAADQFSELIQRVNKANPKFTLHVGDIKSGQADCTDKVFED